MKPYYEAGPVTLYHGDCRTVMASLPDASVHAVVTDPPYELTGKSGGGGFMGKSWDSTGVAFDVAIWREALRVLKPGGHLLAFGGSRTYHRMAVAIEDAGFEVRDSIAWLYGSGMPKSLDVSKAIDKHGAGQMRRAKLAHFIASRGVDATWLIERGVADGKSLSDWTTEDHAPSDRNWSLIRDALSVTAEEEAEFEREVIGHGRSGAASIAYARESATPYARTAAATPDAQKWQGWGTALKPSHEPVVCARKPLVGNVASNVLAFGTGALNIDACRVGLADGERPFSYPNGPGGNTFTVGGGVDGTRTEAVEGNPAGRWPANVLLDESQAEVLDAQSGRSVSRIGKPRGAESGEGWGMTKTGTEYADEGGASRFFPTFKYEAKAPTSERPVVDGVAHATVKPLKLMQWLVRLVTPPGGVVLDPFAGSGTTLEAAVLEGFDSIGIELEEAHLPLIKSRFKKPFDQYLDLGDAG